MHMSKQEKALKRLAAVPKDFTWSELVSLMKSLSYELQKAGGSGRKFVHTATKSTLFIHEPHPSKILKPYQVRDVIHHLSKEHEIN
jgi:predicted RNA binding protein YcfA (HicA-like mRNA interferase family)